MTTASGKLQLPEFMSVIREGGQIVIVRRWPKSAAIFLGLFGAYIGWEIFGRYILGQSAWNRAVFELMIFAAPVIWMMYFGLAGLFNRTRITLSRDGILVRHGPLPWVGNVHLERADFKQFYVKTHFERGALSNYRIQALLRNDKLVNLVNGPGMSQQQAAYIRAALQQAFRTSDAAPRDAVIADAGLTIRQAGSNLEIEKRWFDRYTIRNSVFSALWLGFSGWMTLASYTNFGKHPLWPLDPDRVGLITLWMSLFFVVGLLFACRAATQWVNRTFLTISSERLSIRHGPLSWRGSMAIAIEDIRQLQVKQSSLARRVRPGQYVHTFEVHALLKYGRSRKLMGGFDMPIQAQQLKQEIETCLAKRKVAVSGLAAVDEAGIQEKWEKEMLHGEPSHIPMAGMSERKRLVLARVMASFLGLLAVSGGVFMLAHVSGLHQAGATVMNQLIPGLAAFVALSIGLMLVALPNKLKADHVFWLYLFWATFLAFLLMFLLLFIRGR